MFCIPLLTWSCFPASPSRSPARRNRSLEREDRRSRSPRNRSPEPRRSPPTSRGRKRSLTPDDGSPQERHTPSPKNSRLAAEQDGSDYSDSPRRKSGGGPVSPERESPIRSYRSPSEANGRSRSASPRDDRSPVDEDDDNRRSPRGSETPWSVWWGSMKSLFAYTWASTRPMYLRINSCPSEKFAWT